MLADTQYLRVMPCGYIQIFEKDRQRVFGADGSTKYDSEYPFAYGDNPPYRDENGNAVAGEYDSDTEMSFIAAGTDGTVASAVSFYDKSTGFTDNPGNRTFITKPALIGFDAQRRAYFFITKTTYQNGVMSSFRQYLLRLDIENKTTQTLEIPFVEEKDL